MCLRVVVYEPSLRICDLHCDTALLWAGGASPLDPTLHVSLPRLHEGHVALQVFAICAPPTLPPGSSFSFTVEAIHSLRSQLRSHSTRIKLCRNSRELHSAWNEGKIAAVLAVENGDAIEGDLKKLERLYQLGVRMMTLVHSRSNDWVVSCGDKQPAFAGLSDFGLEVVKLMEALGMIVDVSHAHDLAVERILQVGQKPIVASHSCVRRLCPIPRNLGDSLLEGIAESSGVIGVNFHPGFLDHSYLKRTEEKTEVASTDRDRMLLDAGADHSRHLAVWRSYTREFLRLVRPERVPLESLLRQFDYIVNLVGPEAVAFGSDFDGIPDTPEEIDDCRGFLRICDALRRRGYSPEILEKISFSNFVRVFTAVCDGGPG